MSDNVILNVGTGGDTAAADDIGGVKYQRVKVTLGADGVDDGDVSASNPIPVSLANASTATNQSLQTDLLDTLQQQNVFLRRMVKMLEPSASEDVQGRQRVTVDSITTALTLTTVTTVSAVTGITNALPTGSNIIGQILLAIPHSRDLSRVAYNTGPRSNLTWS